MAKSVAEHHVRLTAEIADYESKMHRAARATEDMESARRKSSLAGAVETFYPQNQARADFTGLLGAKAASDSSAKAVEDAKARKTAAIERRAQVEARISQAMALQRSQALAQFTAKSEPYDITRLNAFSAATNHATDAQKQLWAAQIQTRVSANMLAYSLGTGPTGAAGVTRKLGNTADDSLKSYKRFSLGVTNAGYQIQDFFVQVASGQSKLTALAQQLPQLLGPIGMWGALAGAGVAIGAVAYNAFKASRATKDLAEDTRTLNQVIAENIALIRERTILEDPKSKAVFAQRDLSDAEGAFRRQYSVVSEIEERLAGARLELIRIKKTSDPLNLAATDDAIIYTERAIRILSKQAAAAREELSKLTTPRRKTALDVDRPTVEADQEAVKSVEDYEARVRAARRENELFGETAAQSISRLRTEWVNLVGAGPQDPLKIEQLRGQILSAEAAMLRESEAIRDQINPMREKVRQQERLNALVKEGLLLPSEVASLRARQLDADQQRIRIPSSLQMNTGAQSTGGLAGNAGGATIIDLNRQMLAALERITRNTALMAGPN